MLVKLGSIDSLVLKEDTTLVKVGGLSKVGVESAWDDNKKNEEGTEQDSDLVVLLKEVSWESNGHGVTSRTIWVSILLEVLISCLVGKHLFQTILVNLWRGGMYLRCRPW